VGVRVLREKKRQDDRCGGGRHSGDGEQAAPTQAARPPRSARHPTVPKQPIDATEPEELTLAVRARAYVGEQGGVVAVVEQVG
jgi:hypothetical protein